MREDIGGRGCLRRGVGLCIGGRRMGSGRYAGRQCQLGGRSAICGWLSRLTGKEYRLLTEAEWEYAARAASNTRFSWGNELGADNANCSDCGSTWSLQTAPVGSFTPNALALHDVPGNVWEWVEDSWHENYQAAPTHEPACLNLHAPHYRLIRTDPR